MANDKQASGSQEQHEDRTPSLSAQLRIRSIYELFASFHFGFGEHYAGTQRVDAVTTKNFRQWQNLAGRCFCALAPLPWQAFESKFDRDSDFEAPVAVFVLQVELYIVTR